ncbi:DNA (cytosine-5-)-methyltransferase, partial [Lactobacillus crispatus]
MINNVVQGDTIAKMKEIPDNSVDLLLVDLPYGTTQNKWDSVIPLPDLW